MSRFPMTDADFLRALAEAQGRGSLEDYPAYVEEDHLNAIADQMDPEEAAPPMSERAEVTLRIPEGEDAPAPHCHPCGLRYKTVPIDGNPNKLGYRRACSCGCPPQVALDALALLKRGDCWCAMAIGHPGISEHSNGCLFAQRATGVLL